MPTLLEKAKAIKLARRMNRVSEEQLELVQAWLNDEITVMQVMKVTGFSSGKVYVMLAIGARELTTRLRKEK